MKGSKGHVGANAGSLKYNRQVSQYPSDIIGYEIDDREALENKPIPFVNKLPVDVIMTQEKVFGDPRELDYFIPRGVIGAHKTLNIPYNEIDDGDLFHFQYLKNTQNGGVKRFVCPSYNMTKRHGQVNIGAVFSYPSYRRDIHPGGDLSSISVHNLIPWPLTIYRDGRPVMYIQANQNLDDPLNHGNLTISPGVHYDNFNLGLNVGTKFEVYINKDQKEVFMCTFKINDINENEIFIGGVSAIIGLSVATGANKTIAKKQHTGRAIYRIGPNIPLDKVPYEGVGILAKNAKGTDMVRATLHSNRRSTNTIARHPQLSGGNTTSGIYL